MITTEINITPFLAEYIRGKYNNGAIEPVNIPQTTDLYHVLWDLMAKRPAGYNQVDRGNLSIILPDRRVGKDPMYYNYLAPAGVKIIQDKIRSMFNAELHSMLLENDQNGHELDNIDVVHQFLCMYCIESISEDALIKNYYRWRENMRKRKARREYKKRLKSEKNYSDQRA